MAYTTQYIGSRYVPIFADPAEWNNTRTYEPLTIVLHEGNSYTSRQFVPMGIELTNEDYWLETGNYNAQLEQYRKEALNAISGYQYQQEELNAINSIIPNYSKVTNLPFNTNPHNFNTSQNIAIQVFGNEQNGVGQSIKIDSKDNVPEITRAPTEYIAGVYKCIDSVGQFIENNFKPYTDSGTSENISSINGTNITFYKIPTTIKVGSFIYFNNRSVLSKVMSINENTIYVDNFYSTTDGSIINVSNIENYIINPVTRIWGQCVNLQFAANVNGSGVAAEFGIVNSNHNTAQGEGITVIAQDGNTLNGMSVHSASGIDYNSNNCWKMGYHVSGADNGFYGQNCINAFNATCRDSKVIIPDIHYAYTTTDRKEQTGYVHYDASYGGYFKNCTIPTNNSILKPQNYSAYLITGDDQVLYLPAGRKMGDTITIYNMKPVQLKPINDTFIINWINGSSNDNVPMPINLISTFVWDGSNWFTSAPLYKDRTIYVSADGQEIELPNNAANGIKCKIVTQTHNITLKAPTKYPLNCNDANVAAGNTVLANPNKRQSIYDFIFYNNVWITSNSINV